jgi:hypothetical protein
MQWMHRASSNVTDTHNAGNHLKVQAFFVPGMLRCKGLRLSIGIALLASIVMLALCMQSIRMKPELQERTTSFVPVYNVS